MHTRTNVATSTALSFESSKELVRALEKITPTGPRARVTLVGGITTDVRIVEVRELGGSWALGTLSASDAQYLSAHRRPDPDDVTWTDLADVAEIHVL